MNLMMEFPENIVADRHETSGRWVLHYLTDEQALLCSSALKFISWINNEIKNNEKYNLTNNSNPNSWKAGFDSGEIQGLKQAKDFMEDNTQ